MPPEAFVFPVNFDSFVKSQKVRLTPELQMGKESFYSAW